MSKTTTIVINGRLYNAATGKPVTDSAPQPKQVAQNQAGTTRSFSDIGMSQAAHPTLKAVEQPAKKAPARARHPVAQAVHRRPQKSETLYRKALKKPVAELPSASADSRSLPGRSPLISKFGPNITIHPNLARKAEPADEPVAPAQIHPTVAKVVQKVQTTQQLSGKALKEQLIKERLAEVSDTPKKDKKKGFFSRKPRLAAVLSTTLALLLLGGYLTYMNLPVISMQVAASRAGVNATFPTYKPDGYSLNGPITYAPGEVSINYKSTTNENDFKITQKPSNWDSQGLLDNYVTRQTENYLTFQESGVTVYTFGNHAAWVNGGIVYTLDGSASLSSDQVLRLAKSM
ncbi:MAG TPA: hypothetical protein VLA88_02555 [Candidatus Saccharimonadales bacterium]|nr:hypothetical protein [Candidatus Saccharimonadales bacterium]